MKKVKQFFKVLIRFILVVAILAGLGYGALKYSNKFKGPTPETAVLTTDENQKEIDRIKSEQQFQAETELRARKLLSERKLEAENAKHGDLVKSEDARHKEEVEKIESELEAIRKSEIDLGLSTSFK